MTLWLVYMLCHWARLFKTSGFSLSAGRQLKNWLLWVLSNLRFQEKSEKRTRLPSHLLLHPSRPLRNLMRTLKMYNITDSLTTLTHEQLTIVDFICRGWHSSWGCFRWRVQVDRSHIHPSVKKKTVLIIKYYHLIGCPQIL